MDESLDRLVRFIIEHEAKRRWVVAGAALVNLVGRLPQEEWPAFVHEHFPFDLARADELMGKLVRRGGMIRCTGCGAELMPVCACGQPYNWLELARAPPRSAQARAETAILANPKLALRAIGRKIGVSLETVRRANAAITGRSSRRRVSANVSPADGAPGDGEFPPR